MDAALNVSTQQSLALPELQKHGMNYQDELWLRKGQIGPSKDIFELKNKIAQRGEYMAKIPLWQRPLAYLKQLPGDLWRSLDPRHLLGSTPSQLKASLKSEMGTQMFSKGGMFALGMDLLFTTVPNTWKKLTSGDVMGALGELGKGTVLSAGGIAATAAFTALFPGIGIPGLILSNFAYDAGKKLVSSVTGLKQDNDSAEPAPYLNPAKLPAQLAQSVDPSQGVNWQSLSPASQQALAQALQQNGLDVSRMAHS